MAPASKSLVTRPLDELAGHLYLGDGRMLSPESLAASVGAMQPGLVLLTISHPAYGTAAELHLTPADVLELASRLLRMAYAVHEAARK